MNLKELSRTLGLSPTTVSRALNGYPEVSETTRARVISAARRHNYAPDTRAKALATGRAMMIGHVIPHADRNEVVNPIFADFIAGASEAYRNAGYDIVLSVAADDDDERIYREMAARRSVDGVILHAPRREDRRIGLLREIGLPFVVHGRSSGLPADYDWIDVDNRRAFTRATEFLVDLGHRRIALVNGLEHMDFAYRRRSGYLAGLSARGMEPDTELMLSGEMTETYGFDAARRLLDMPNPPTAFLAASVITAFGIRRAADAAGLRLGRDISVITHDDDLSYFGNGGDEAIFTALRSSVREAGRRAAASLISLVEAPREPNGIMLETDLVIGASTGPARRLAPLRKA